ncbi:hypothetical protein [Catenulispora rubra]|uniref:hypothetical protein n=1 Tax=Catenulispora rubra TaxID=280293 RepID=UPI00189250B8|nr:hypothetical protein [Catenulispora rubra]
MSTNMKAGAAVAAVVLLLFLIVRPTTSSGHHFKVTATEYDCNVKIADDPRPLNKEVLSTVAIKCVTPPKQTSLVLQLQYRKDGSSPWTNDGDARAYTGIPGPDYTDINITQPCKAGSFRIAYQLQGVAAVLGTSIQEQQQFGGSKDISQSQCDNS